MGIKNAFGKLIGIDTRDEFDDDFSEEELASAKEELLEEERKKDDRKNLFNSTNDDEKPRERMDITKTLTGIQTVVVNTPKSFDDCPKLVDSLKARRPVVINLESIETEAAKKIFNFMSGATYALNGTCQRIANNIFLFAPEHVNVTANEERNFDFGQNKSPWK